VEEIWIDEEMRTVDGPQLGWSLVKGIETLVASVSLSLEDEIAQRWVRCASLHLQSSQRLVHWVDLLIQMARKMIREEVEVEVGVGQRVEEAEVDHREDRPKVVEGEKSSHFGQDQWLWASERWIGAKRGRYHSARNEWTSRLFSVEEVEEGTVLVGSQECSGSRDPLVLQTGSQSLVIFLGTGRPMESCKEEPKKLLCW
jgi:hypothetical protein